MLIGEDRLDADIAGQRVRADRLLDVRLEVARHQPFGDVVCLHHDVAIRILDELIDPGIEQGDRIIADHRPEAEIAQARRREPELRRDRYIGRSVGVGDKPEERLVRGQRLGAIGVVQAELDALQETVGLLLDLEPVLLQLVPDDPVVIIAVLTVADLFSVHAGLIAAPAERAGQLDQIIVAVIQRRAEHRAVRAAGEADRIDRARILPARGAGVRFKDQFVAVCFRIAEIGHHVPAIVAGPFAVPAERIELRLALEHVVTHHALDVGEGPSGREDTVIRGDVQLRRIGLRRIVIDVETERQFDPALDLIVAEIGIEAVEGRREIGRWTPFERPLQAKPLERGRRGIGFGTTDHDRVRGSPAAGVAPGVEFLNLIRFVEIARRQRHADRVIGELVDEGAVDAVAHILRFGVELAEIGIGAAPADRNRALAIFEGTDRLEIDRARQALPDDIGLWRLIDEHRADDFGGILVIFDSAIVAGRGLLAPVEQGRREVGCETADRDRVRATRDALRGQARQARDRFRDRGVGQLANVFRRNRFHDLIARFLGVDRALQRSAEAGDDDVLIIFLGRGCIGGGRRLRLRGGRAEQQQGCAQRAHAGAQRQGIAELRRLTARRCDHAISPLRLHGVFCALSIS